MALTVCLALVAGCSDRSLAGRYVGKRDIQGPAHIAGTASKVELNLKPDGKFDLLNLSMPYAGDWQVLDGNIVLTIQTAAGVRQPKPTEIMVARVEDGFELRDDRGLDPRPVLLRKE